MNDGLEVHQPSCDREKTLKCYKKQKEKKNLSQFGVQTLFPLLHEKNQSLINFMQLYKILLPPAFVELEEEIRLLLPNQSHVVIVEMGI